MHPLLGTEVVFGVIPIVGEQIVLGHRHVVEEPLVANLHRLEGRGLALPTDLVLHLRVGDEYALLDQRLELGDHQILTEPLLELLRAQLEVAPDHPLVGLLADESTVAVLEHRVAQDCLLDLFVGDHQAGVGRLGEVELAFDEVAHGLAGQIHLIAEIVPLVAELLLETVIHPPHLGDELGLGDRTIADLNGGSGAAAPAGTAGSPVHEDEQHEHRHHTPQDELQVSQIVAEPLQRHDYPPEASSEWRSVAKHSAWCKQRSPLAA